MKHRFQGWPVVYRAYSADGTLLYVGATSCYGQRRYDHEVRRQPWCPAGVRWMTEPYATRREAFAAERAAIRAEHPLWNRRPDDREPPATVSVAILDAFDVLDAQRMDAMKRSAVEGAAASLRPEPAAVSA
jgi:hypothetical protein